MRKALLSLVCTAAAVAALSAYTPQQQDAAPPPEIAKAEQTKTHGAIAIDKYAFHFDSAGVHLDTSPQLTAIITDTAELEEYAITTANGEQHATPAFTDTGTIIAGAADKEIAQHATWTATSPPQLGATVASAHQIELATTTTSPPLHTGAHGTGVGTGVDVTS